ncbi:MAG: SDR family oxidoreductase [Vicinamibacterales bacterium]
MTRPTEGPPRGTGLRDRVVIITGSARGIGRATARRFAREGARVACWDVAPAAPLDPSGVPDDPARIRQARVDVTKAADVEAAVATVLDAWSRVDVLVNNAGVLRDAQLVKWRDGRVLDTMSEADFDAVLDVNLRGVFVCARAVVPPMIRQGGGVILNATSIVARHGNFGQTNYVASKAAVVGLTETWARELGRHGIRVNAVAPGFIDTPMARSVPAERLAWLESRTPLGRLGTPEDVAEAYVWLASDQARFVHGAVLPVDGGLVLGT